VASEAVRGKRRSRAAAPGPPRGPLTRRSIGHVLVAIKDPWARSLPALVKAVQLARALGARLRIFHAITEPVYLNLADRQSRSLARLETQRRERLRKRLETLAKHPRRQGIPVTTELEWDFPAHEAIVRAARQFNADLIIAECHPTRHAPHWLLRFADWELLRTSPVPVLLVKNRRRYRRPTVLAAVDPSHAYAKPANLDETILQYGSLFANTLRGKLHAVHAYSPTPSGRTAAEMTMPEVIEPFKMSAASRARAALDQTLSSIRIPRDSRHLLCQHPIDAIQGVAREIGSQIVVMGAISRSGLNRIFIGNTAERILDQLSCDVLVVKPQSFRSHIGRTRRGAQVIALSTLEGDV